MNAAQNITTQVAIAGGGPAGMMLGFLLARAGIQTTVLEKWPDFNRDFRGDTIHPSTMQVMHELGLLEEFLKLPHQELKQIGGQIGPEFVGIADFTHLKQRCPFIALIPQWDFLNFILRQAGNFPAFHLHMKTEVTGLIEENGRVVGLTAQSPDGPLEFRAALVIGADGRHSAVRDKAKLQNQSLGAPMDVLWFRVSRKESDPPQTLGHIDNGKMMIMLNRNDYWQCGFLIRKGDLDNIKRNGLPAFHGSITALAPFLRDRVGEIADWEKIKLLTVTVDRLTKWHRPGLLCIGDAAHAMSPIGGVGINLAIQDAVAAANILRAPLLAGMTSEADLQSVQRRREWPTKMTQRFQVMIQNRVVNRVLGGSGHPKLAWPMKLLRRFPYLRRIPARVIGIGFRPEHVKS